MHDEDSGSAQQGGWQPPEYVSPWLPASGSPEGSEGANDTISYGGGPDYDAGQGPSDQPGYQAGPGYGAGQPGPGYGPGYGCRPGYGPGPAGPGGPVGPATAAARGSRAAAVGSPGTAAAPAGTAGGGPVAPDTVRPVTARTRGAGTGPRRLLLDPDSAGPSPTWRSRCSRRAPALASPSRSTSNASTSAALVPHRAAAAASAAAGPAATAPAAPAPGATAAAAPGPTRSAEAASAASRQRQRRLRTGPADNSGTGSLNATALAAKVDPGLVDVTSDLKYSGATAEGTGMVISSNGLVLTNNHVIDESTSVSAQIVTSGRTYTAKVIGYDSTDDVALLQLVGASGLKTVSLADSSQVKVGEAVLALGNAGGRGGLPSTAQGTVNALNQSIKASDSGADTTEDLHGMLETNAPIQEGDSGGPLVNGSGQVIGMDTAANPGHRRGRRGHDGHPGLRDPDRQGHLDRRRDQRREGLATVHIGLSGFIGVNVGDAAKPTSAGSAIPGRPCFTPAVSSGALVCDAIPDAPARRPAWPAVT